MYKTSEKILAMARINYLIQSQILHETGGRDHNEDAVYPVDPNMNDRLFMVCDGVGGQHKGEVASALVCKYFAAYFSQFSNQDFEDNFPEEALRDVEEKLREDIHLHPEYSGMASTLTLVYFMPGKAKVIIGWIGDSRVYHVRDGNILFKTKDHSEVQSLIDMGEITEKEALNHPKKNIITRAVNGRREARIDQHIIEGIRENDFFMLCTDGILEHLGDDEIRAWFKESESTEKIKEKIYKNAVGRTKDNFSMILIKVEEKQNSEIKNKISSFLRRIGL